MKMEKTMRRNIKIFVMDVDGTLTDGKIYMGKTGELYKNFNIKDGYGIKNILCLNGITPVIISGRSSKFTENRCSELNITHLYQGISNKREQLLEIIKEQRISLSQVAYIGDDLNDIECMKLIKANGGLIGCPADAVREVRNIADFISVFRGGEGAVREMIDKIADRK